MPAGLQIFDASGNLIVDLTDRLTQFAGSATITAGSSGSVSITGMGSGNKVWCSFVPDSNGNSFISNMPKLTVGVAGVSWSYDSGAGILVGGTLLYGFY